MNTPFTVLSDEQFRQLLSDREDLKQQHRQALDLAQQQQAQNVGLLAGLKHFTAQQVADLFCCSLRQVHYYAESGALVPRDLMGKRVYSGQQLLDFAGQYDAARLPRVQAELSHFPTRRPRRTKATNS